MNMEGIMAEMETNKRKKLFLCIFQFEYIHLFTAGLNELVVGS